MSHTLANGPLWVAVAAVAGVAVGWFLHRLRSGRVASRAADDRAELAQAREQATQLAQDCERLEGVLADCRQQAESHRMAVVGAVVANVVAERDAVEELTTERDRLAGLVAGCEATIGDLRARLWNQDARVAELQRALAERSLATAPPAPDLVVAAAVLGEKVRSNDLTVIEGIGPKIADMLQRDGGIRTWWELHCTDVAALRALLEAAGPRFQVHDPDSWPHQAGLLASGEWQQFKTLVDGMRSGKLGT